MATKCEKTFSWKSRKVIKKCSRLTKLSVKATIR